MTRGKKISLIILTPFWKLTSEEEPGKSGVGIAHVRLHPPPRRISIFSLRRPHFPLIEESWEIELRVSLTFRLASPKLTQPRLRVLIRESGEEGSCAVDWVCVQAGRTYVSVCVDKNQGLKKSLSVLIPPIIKYYAAYPTAWGDKQIPRCCKAPKREESISVCTGRTQPQQHNRATRAQCELRPCCAIKGMSYGPQQCHLNASGGN